MNGSGDTSEGFGWTCGEHAKYKIISHAKMTAQSTQMPADARTEIVATLSSVQLELLSLRDNRRWEYERSIVEEAALSLDRVH